MSFDPDEVRRRLERRHSRQPDPLDGHDRCPMCNSSIAGHDKRSVTSPMGKALIRHLRADPLLGYVHTPDIWAPCKHVYEWQWHSLIVPHPQDRGFWAVTAKGRDFCYGEASVHKYARTRFDPEIGRQRMVELWGPTITMRELAPFELDELLSSRTPYLRVVE